jgi:hypothetical protein
MRAIFSASCVPGAAWAARCSRAQASSACFSSEPSPAFQCSATYRAGGIAPADTSCWIFATTGSGTRPVAAKAIPAARSKSRWAARTSFWTIALATGQLA